MGNYWIECTWCIKIWNNWSVVLTATGRSVWMRLPGWPRWSAAAFWDRPCPAACSTRRWSPWMWTAARRGRRRWCSASLRAQTRKNSSALACLLCFCFYWCGIMISYVCAPRARVSPKGNIQNYDAALHALRCELFGLVNRLLSRNIILRRNVSCFLAS